MPARITRSRGRRAAPTRRPVDRKVPKTYRLNEAKIEAARAILRAKTATEAIETALDMVVFRRELVEGTRALFGSEIKSIDES